MLSLVLAPLFIVGFGIGAILYEIASDIEDSKEEERKKAIEEFDKKCKDEYNRKYHPERYKNSK